MQTRFGEFRSRNDADLRFTTNDAEAMYDLFWKADILLPDEFDSDMFAALAASDACGRIWVEQQVVTLLRCARIIHQANREKSTVNGE